MEASIHEVARWAGTTSRALRHYGDVGLLAPSRVGANGYRWYDGDALVRLQRILLLRELGLGLDQIRVVLDRQEDEAIALRTHLQWLRAERERVARQIASVERTLAAREKGEDIVAEQTFDGFDHTRYRAEVEERWGARAYAESDAWWRGLGEGGRREFRHAQERLQADWLAASSSGLGPESDEVVARWTDAVPQTVQVSNLGVAPGPVPHNVRSFHAALSPTPSQAAYVVVTTLEGVIQLTVGFDRNRIALPGEDLAARIERSILALADGSA